MALTVAGVAVVVTMCQLPVYPTTRKNVSLEQTKRIICGTTASRMLQMPSSQGESGKGWAMSVIMHVVHGVNTYRDASVASYGKRIRT
jgi:hypothetical protein